MPYRTDLAYQYDGSFEGLLCCVFESYERKEIPFDIYSAEEEQGFLFESKWIETDSRMADRVFNSIPVKISPEAQEIVRMGWFTCAQQKEILLFRFLRLGFTHGRKVMDMLTDDTVDSLHKAVRHLTTESHNYKGFVRFSVYGHVLAAVIEPQNMVLPVIRDHFCDRFQSDTFMIFDKTHGMALVHQPGESRIISIDELTLPDTDATEAEYRRLWKRYYDSIAIRGRLNPRLRMSHMPKRYWSQLTEFGDPSAYSTQSADRSSYAAESKAKLTYADDSGGIDDPKNK